MADFDVTPTELERSVGGLREQLRSGGHPLLEARYELQIARRLTLFDDEVVDAASTELRGGSVRGLWQPERFVAMTGPRDLATALPDLARSAQCASIAEREPILDHAGLCPLPEWDDLASILRPLQRYRDVARETAPNLSSYRCFYADQRRLVWYGSGDGTSIVQSFAEVTLIITLRTRKLDSTGFSFVSLAATEPGTLLTIDGTIRDAAHHAQRLIEVAPIEPGPTTVILDPCMAGLFAHEAIGHLSEADYLSARPDAAAAMHLGRTIGPETLTVIDDPTTPGLRGSYRYDDEGTPARPSTIVSHGAVAGRLHSRATAAYFEAEPSGHARAQDFSFPPLVRMSNTYVAPGSAPLADLFEDVEDGLYLKRPMGGEAQMESFTFGANEVYRVRHGRVAEPVQPVLLIGDLFETLKTIDAVASDLAFEGSAGGCAKEDQQSLPVDCGGAHLRLRRCLAVPL